MATGAEVLNYLIPTGGWVISGDDFEGITFLEAAPITKKQFTDAFAVVDAQKAQAEADRLALIASRNAKLLALGLTPEELSL